MFTTNFLVPALSETNPSDLEFCTFYFWVISAQNDILDATNENTAVNALGAFAATISITNTPFLRTPIMLRQTKDSTDTAYLMSQSGIDDID